MPPGSGAHGLRAASDDLAQGDAAVVGRHALVPVGPESFFQQALHASLGQVSILEAAAGQDDLVSPTCRATATMISTSVLWNFAAMTPGRSAVRTSSSISSNHRPPIDDAGRGALDLEGIGASHSHGLDRELEFHRRLAFKTGLLPQARDARRPHRTSGPRWR